MFEHPLLAFFYITGDTNPDHAETFSAPGLSVYLGDETKRGCLACRNYNVAQVEDFEGARATLSSENATYFPDFIGAPKYAIISERVKNDLKENGVRGFVAHRVPVYPGFDFALKGQPIP